MPQTTTTWPRCPDGAAVILFGGSFDPPHAGHVEVSTRALRTLRADALWWLLAPRNPLKPPARDSLDTRADAARAMLPDARMQALTIEDQLGSTHTNATVAALRAQYPRVRFVWLMGADAFAQLHRWRNWADLVAQIPIAVYPRGHANARAGVSPAAQRFRHARCAPHTAAHLADCEPPAWLLLAARWNPASSHALKTEQGKAGEKTNA